MRSHAGYKNLGLLTLVANLHFVTAKDSANCTSHAPEYIG